MTDSLTTLRILQLASPAMPVGAYNFSQGLEYACDAGWVRDEPSTQQWILGVARDSLRTLDLPILARLHAAWRAEDTAQVDSWNQRLIAGRETQELRAEERHLGRSLAKVLIELGIDAAAHWLRRDASYATLFALACVRGHIAVDTCCQAYLWTWAENQALAALKLLPIGQSAGQRILNSILIEIPDLCDHALHIEDADIGASVPRLSMASALHETQYSRLFRS
jgi:urease accessory protein